MHTPPSPPVALCPVSITWADDTAHITSHHLSSVNRLVAIDPSTDMPTEVTPRAFNGDDVITASSWLDESQQLAESYVSRLRPMRYMVGGESANNGDCSLAEWVPCVKNRDIAEDGSTYVHFMLTCLGKGEHFGETKAVVVRVGWETDQCRAITGLYELAKTAASIHAEASDPNWAEAMFIRRSALRVTRSAEKRFPAPITWADANAALNSRSRQMAVQYGIDDIRAAALAQAENDGLLERIQGNFGLGSKWLRTSKSLPSRISGGRWSRLQTLDNRSTHDKLSGRQTKR